ncbi:hypothetical protein [Geodermatophilus sp. CPCC 205506]|uniref:hypothetical protein n=1 Tax=Geodermatophilus sp. CPCC 205506 TaxID=2936596 RepID=UPI003EE9B6EA
MVTIHNLHGVNVTVVEGVQYIGPQVHQHVHVPALRQAAHDLELALGRTSLPPSTRAAVDEVVQDIGTEVQRADPDRPRVAGKVQRLTELLTSAGALTTAAGGLVQPLQTFATWLGQTVGPLL